MYHTTGLARDQIIAVVAQIHSTSQSDRTVTWPRRLGLFKSVVAALTYLRRNRVQAEIGEMFEVSQPTISRAVTGLTPALAQVLGQYVPTAQDLPAGVQYIVDGTLLPCWSWADRPQLFSGKHRTTGLNVQVVCDLSGRVRWISDPVEGHRHDTAALALTGVLTGHDPINWIGDKGYIGNAMITPIRKPAHRSLLDWEKQFNRDINAIRYMIERTIANIKTWRILHTDYRRPLASFPTTISAVVGLIFFTLAE